MTLTWTLTERESAFAAMPLDRAELICLMLLQRTARERGEPASWREMIHNRRPPLPYWIEAQAMPNVCPICRQLCYRAGDYRPVGDAKPNQRWHVACLKTYQVWQNQFHAGPWLWQRQKQLCAALGTPIEYATWGEVDHKEPLWRVQRMLAAYEWPGVMRMWGVGNLQLLSRKAHTAKSAREAGERAKLAAEAGVTVEEL